MMYADTLYVIAHTGWGIQRQALRILKCETTREFLYSVYGPPAKWPKVVKRETDYPNLTSEQWETKKTQVFFNQDSLKIG